MLHHSGIQKYSCAEWHGAILARPRPSAPRLLSGLQALQRAGLDRDELQLVTQRLNLQLEGALHSFERFAAISVLPLELGQGALGVCLTLSETDLDRGGLFILGRTRTRGRPSASLISAVRPSSCAW